MLNPKLSLRKTLTFFFAFILLLSSCDKTVDDNKKFDDIFDTSDAIELNRIIKESDSIDELKNKLGENDLELPDALANISLSQIITTLESDLKISSEEKDLLLKNHYNTYLKVLHRFGNVVEDFKSAGIDFSNIDEGIMEQYSIKVIEEPDNYYGDDYYSGVVAVQRYLNDEVLAPLVVLNSLAKEKSANMEAGLVEDLYAFLMLQEINTMQELMYWILYWLLNYNHHSGGLIDY